MIIWLHFLKHFLWLCCYGIFNSCRQVLWLFSGTYFRIRKNHHVDSYKGSIQVLDILCRHKVDPINQPSASDNFITWHRCFVDPEYVLNNQVSLYTINQKEALFIEVGKGVDPSRSDAGSFFRVAQWKLAHRLLIMPVHVFHILGQKIGLPKVKIIFIGNTSRCGSTLMTQVFEETGYCMAYSEPDALNSLTQLKRVLNEVQMLQYTHDCLAFLCKPVHGKAIQAYVFKLQSLSMVELPMFGKVVPESYKMFMYRDGLAVCKSLARAIQEMPMSALICHLGRWSSKVTQCMVTQLGMPSEHFECRVLSKLHIISILWASLMKYYIDFRTSGMNIVGIRYEDLIDNPTHFFKAVFKHCDLPFDADAIERAMSRDSQRGSQISMHALKKYSFDDFTMEVKEQTDKICDFFNVPHLDQPYIAPGTIGCKIV